MAHSVRITKTAARELNKLTKRNQKLAVDLLTAIYDLEEDPRPNGHKKLSGHDDLYRIRVGEYRVVYEFRDGEVIVSIVRIGHRRDVYKAKF